MNDFSFKHCTYYGIIDKYFNVIHESGKVIGYISEDNLMEFIHGITKDFRPIPNWKNEFSVGLKIKLGLPRK